MVNPKDCSIYLKLDNGKYIVYINDNPLSAYEFKALRHGEEWRDLCGDNLILSLVYKIDELKDIIETLENAANGK